MVWGCEKFHLYLYWTQFKVYTDHKPLELIYSPKRRPPPCIGRWALCLQPYCFKVIHMPGKTNFTDVLSRLPLSAQSPRDPNIAEEYVHFITERAVPKSMTLEQIAKGTQEDTVLQKSSDVCCTTNGRLPSTFSSFQEFVMSYPLAKACS